MEQTIERFLVVTDRMRKLRRELDDLKTEAAGAEQRVIGYVTGLNEERLVIGRYEVYVRYRRQYDYDLPVVRRILEPRQLFETVARVVVGNERFNTLMLKPQLFTAAEFDDLLNAVRVKSVVQSLGVWRHGTR